MNLKKEIKGLWVPLITPFNQGKLDKESLISVINNIESHVDGFVPCLSSGEGKMMSSELWEEVLKTVVENTKKPIAVGILRDSLEEIERLSKTASQYHCIAIVIALQGNSKEDQIEFCKEVSNKSVLPIILYNTEKIHIDDTSVLSEISKNQNIVAIKDSSQNQTFFDGAVKIKKEGKIDISILQGMENKLFESVGADGYLIALANVEPELCKKMLEKPSEDLNAQVMKKWDELGLASDTWYVGIKQALHSRDIIKSEELIK